MFNGKRVSERTFSLSPLVASKLSATGIRGVAITNAAWHWALVWLCSKAMAYKERKNWNTNTKRKQTLTYKYRMLTMVSTGIWFSCAKPGNLMKNTNKKNKPVWSAVINPIGLFRPRQHVSGCFWIRNFLSPDTASVHTHPANSDIFKSAFQSGK